MGSDFSVLEEVTVADFVDGIVVGKEETEVFVG